MGVKVKLGTFHLWKSTHYSLFPRVMKRTDSNRLYTTKEIREELFLSDQKTNNQKKFKRHILWENIWDVEKDDHHIIRVRGLPFFTKKGPKQYMITEIGEKLGDLYQDQNVEWKIYLSEIVLKFDPRLRLIIYLMSKHGCEFTKKPTYALLSKKINYKNIFDKDKKNNLDFLLKKYADEAIGQFILQRVGLEDEGISAVEGVKKETTSMDKSTLTSALRAEFQLLGDIGIVKNYKDKIILNYTKAKELLSRDIYYDLFAHTSTHDFFSALKEAYGNKVRTNNFIGYQELKQEAIRLFPDSNFEYDLEQAINHSKVIIIRGTQGLRSDGEGYKGNRELQLIELSFTY